MNEALEQLKSLKFDNPEFQAGFDVAIRMAIIVSNTNIEKIRELERDIMRLQLRITTLEADKKPSRLYPYVTYYNTSCSDGTKIIKP